MRVVVNGLETSVVVDHHLVHDLLLPRLASLRAREDAVRRFVFLVAPPGTGKSTLAAVLEQRAALHLDSVGLDGFHHPNSYLRTHRRATDGVLLADVKGAPETFDVARLQRVLAASAVRAVCWPIYNRVIHDVVPDARLVDAPLVLLEGNWLLLDEPGWQDLSAHSVLNVFVDADPTLLRERLIERKVRGGLDMASATRFYERSDRPNVERVLQHTDRSKVDLLLQLDADGTIVEKGGDASC